ncbi:hypothetical protein NEIELOOT_01359 [Neisseria elongata subsp. glycolytica ATCC 29315]|uniref:Uncharacterized protein n=1 Tax=Neisseria elongata subsp. glycolytica ATCC 29315 TaxID=546263 RepID=D4DQM0_NEIEG|nr:hypothetical protein NEIELOOT_01359 [Neisseria elongata subsp. glycolytica ATCC 29315]
MKRRKPAVSCAPQLSAICRAGRFDAEGLQTGNYRKGRLKNRGGFQTA